MHRILEYTLFFVLLVSLQVLLFDNVNLSVYLYPLVYIGFILLLPMNTLPIVVLLLGCFMGIVLDFFTGSAGLHTISTVFVSFIRPYILYFTVGADEVRDGGLPIPLRIGFSRFLAYSGILVFVHSFVFFSFEALSARFFHLTLLRVFSSSLLALVIIYFCHLLLPESHNKRSGI